jgi:hypothetical protein
VRLPSVAEAERFLEEGQDKNPGSWSKHSQNVALAARSIAKHHFALDPDTAYVMGLLHDIGRQEGVTGMRHALDGYTFLLGLGYDDAARICLTHSFPVQDARAIFGRWDVSEEEWHFIERYVAEARYDDYDRLIQLCDCLGMAEGIVLLEKRMMDVALRYGAQNLNELTVEKWRAYIRLGHQFSQAIGQSIYNILPGVVETTFGNSP